MMNDISYSYGFYFSIIGSSGDNCSRTCSGPDSISKKPYERQRIVNATNELGRFLFWVLLCSAIAFAASARVFASYCGDPSSGLAFIRINEPKENAFSILVPRGWQAQGGIYRVNAATAGGPLNAIEAKCDLLFVSDPRGTVAFRILPDIVYGHVGIGGGFWQPGSNYQGATVRQLEDAPTHVQSIFTAIHGDQVSPQVLKVARLPGEVQSLERGLAYTNQIFAQIGLGHMAFQGDAAGAVFEYDENGIRFREVIVTGVVDMRAALTWKNTRTLAFRAPADQFDAWRPVMDIMRSSVRFNLNWVIKEMQGQRERAEYVMKIYDEIRRIDQEIVSRTNVNREEIMNDNYLVLTGQEEYVNPHTNQVERDTDAYRYRWTTPGGDVYYTNNESEDPNIFLHGGGYERTPIRKRRNE